LQQLNKKTRIYPFHFFKKYSWLAAAVILLAAGAWLLTHHIAQKRKIPALAAASRPQQIVPGKTGAVLTLDDGSQLVLDSMGNGIVATQQGAPIVLKAGVLAYDKTPDDNEKLIFNTLSTPTGREFNISLPDGTRAWLNSNSSIRYPIHFNNKERVVYITGEVYFEVAKMSLPPTLPTSRDRLSNRGGAKKVPFIVKISTPAGDAGSVEVLGTHFNINAYENVSKTTLLEGKVKVQSAIGNKQSAILKPGQQASVSQLSNDSSQTITVQQANIDQVMAWRRGFFYFDDASLKEVMQQLARWYDIEVEYRGRVPAITFAGEMSRGMTWAGVVKALEESKVHFSIEGRKIIILP
jgi:hypothetical protein